MFPWRSVKASWPAAERGRWDDVPFWLRPGKAVWMLFYYGKKGVDETTGYEAGVVESIDMEQQRVIVAFARASRLFFKSFADAAQGELLPAANLKDSRSPAGDACFADRVVLHAAGRTVICKGDVFLLNKCSGAAFQVASYDSSAGIMQGRYLLSMDAVAAYVHFGGNSSSGGSSSNSSSSSISTPDNRYLIVDELHPVNIADLGAP